MPVTDGFEYTRARFRTEEQRSCDLLGRMTGGATTLFEESMRQPKTWRRRLLAYGLRRRGWPGAGTADGGGGGLRGGGRKQRNPSWLVPLGSGRGKEKRSCSLGEEKKEPTGRAVAFCCKYDVQRGKPKKWLVSLAGSCGRVWEVGVPCLFPLWRICWSRLSQETAQNPILLGLSLFSLRSCSKSPKELGLSLLHTWY